MLGLGYIALTPDPAKFDPKKALEFFTTAAAKGDAEAMYELGKLYEKGIGTKQDVAKALDLYRRSAEGGFADAINDLGFLTYQGTRGWSAIRTRPSPSSPAPRNCATAGHFNVAALIDDGIVPGKTPEDAAHFLYLALRSGVEDVLTQLTTKPTCSSRKPARRCNGCLREQVLRGRLRRLLRQGHAAQPAPRLRQGRLTRPATRRRRAATYGTETTDPGGKAWRRDRISRRPRQGQAAATAPQRAATAGGRARPGRHRPYDGNGARCRRQCPRGGPDHLRSDRNQRQQINGGNPISRRTTVSPMPSPPASCAISRR